MTGGPIVSPATGEEHRVRIDLPEGIEFEIAEIGNASTKATGAVELDLNDSYGQFNLIRQQIKKLRLMVWDGSELFLEWGRRIVPVHALVRLRAAARGDVNARNRQSQLE